MSLNIYLNFNGNCEAAMKFYESATGGKIVVMQRYGDSPVPCSDAEKNLVLHGILMIGEDKIMFSDGNEKHQVTFGDNFSIAMDFKDDTSIQKAFDGLSAGGTVTMPLQDMFWGAKFGMCRDQFGVNWMFNYDKPKL